MPDFLIICTQREDLEIIFLKKIFLHENQWQYFYINLFVAKFSIFSHLFANVSGFLSQSFLHSSNIVM